MTFKKVYEGVTQGKSILEKYVQWLLCSVHLSSWSVCICKTASGMSWTCSRRQASSRTLLEMIKAQQRI